MSRPHLLLFDVDGTLIKAYNAGRRALEEAFAETLSHHAILYCVIVVVALLSYVILAVAASGAHRLSPTILNIITRLMGLLLAAFGVQFIVTAFKQI